MTHMGGACSSCTTFQLAFRGRRDNGIEQFQESDGGAEWEAALNTNYDWPLGSSTRMRFLVNRNVDTVDFRFSLYYQVDAGGWVRAVADPLNGVHVAESAWQPVVDGRGNTSPFSGRLGVSGWFNGDPPVPPNHAFSAANEYVGDDTPDGFGMDANADAEFEWSVRANPAVISVGAVVEFRMRQQSGTLFTGYTATPSLTVVARVPRKEMVLSH